MYRYRRRTPVRGRGAYYYKPSTAFLNLKGKGGYFGDLWHKYRGYVPRAIGGIGGMMAGNPRAGWDMGAQASKLIGWGAYRKTPARRLRGRGAYLADAPTVSAGEIMYKGNVPSMHSAGENGVRITHKEIIGIINSTTSFNVSAYEINPGINTSFPWVSGIAKNFQQYDINGLCFTFKPTCSDAISSATISAMGSITMSNDQNVYGSAPTSTISMLQSQFAVSGKPSTEILMPIEEDKRNGGKMTNHLLIRTGAVPTGATRQFYDDCVVYIATDGNGVAGTQLGQLFVSYDITFYNPVQLQAGSNTLSAKCQIGFVSSPNPLGGSKVDFTPMFDNIGLTWSDSSTLNISIGNEGYFLIELIYFTASGASTAPAINVIDASTGASLIVADQFGPSINLGYAKVPTAGATSSVCSNTTIIHNANPQNAMTLQCVGATLPAVSMGYLIMTQLNPDIFA